MQRHTIFKLERFDSILVRSLDQKQYVIRNTKIWMEFEIRLHTIVTVTFNKIVLFFFNQVLKGIKVRAVIVVSIGEQYQFFLTLITFVLYSINR